MGMAGLIFGSGAKQGGHVVLTLHIGLVGKVQVAKASVIAAAGKHLSHGVCP
jgi:hypothetical protein